MSRLLTRVFVTCFIMILSVIPAFADQFVTSVGRADIIGSNKDAARNNALTAALREAVEKGIGVWVQSQTEVKDASLVRDEVLTHTQGYVLNHEIIKEKVDGGIIVLTVKAEVAVDKIGADIKKLVQRVSAQMGNPSITFVLTTWEKRGNRGSSSISDGTDVSARIDSKQSHDNVASTSTTESASASIQADESSSSSTRVSAQEQASIRAKGKATVQHSETVNGNQITDSTYSGKSRASMSASGSSSYDGAANVQTRDANNASVKAKSEESTSTRDQGVTNKKVAIDASLKVKKENSYFKIDEEIWKKYPDMTIIDSFQQEFLAKRFNLIATDKAREIALVESITTAAVNPNDRSAVRDMAAKEGANYVARGEIRVLGHGVSEATGNREVKTQIGVEIIDVNSGDIVGSYTNTSSATSSEVGEARMQSIKKNAIQAARTLASQTVDVWQARSLNGRQYTFEIRNIKSIRSQQLPIINAIKEVAQITSQTNPTKTTLLVRVTYKGTKEDLGMGFLGVLEKKTGFSESEFDGPTNEDGKIIFMFK